MTTFDIDVNLHIDNIRYGVPEAVPVNASPELIAAIRQDRERSIERDLLARAIARVKACCSVSIVDRLARALRPAPASC